MEGVAHEPSPSSRLAPARRRARTVKFASAGAALAGFGLVAMVVRGAHPGTATAPATGEGLDLSSRISQEAEQEGSFFQSGSVEPSSPSTQPQASTRTS